MPLDPRELTELVLRFAWFTTVAALVAQKHRPPHAPGGRTGGSVCGYSLHTHDSFGAVWIHPRHLAFWYFFSTEADLQRAQQIGLTARMIESTRTGLLLRGYPREVISEVGIAFASDEDVQRTTNGNYYRYLK